MPRRNKTPPEVLERFGARLRECREDAGLSQVMLARALSVSQVSVSEWEKGQYEPEREFVFRCEDVLDVEPGWLSSLLGYGPAKFGIKGGRPPSRRASIRRAISSDSTLSDAHKAALLATYDAFVSQSPSRWSVRTADCAA